tara:strand:- start:11822 stop:12031 length:210 start_codon:yes stop_codon:yes gene_type:complete
MFDIKEFITDILNINNCCNCNNKNKKEESNIVTTRYKIKDDNEKKIKKDLEKLMEFKQSNNNRRTPVEI